LFTETVSHIYDKLSHSGLTSIIHKNQLLFLTALWIFKSEGVDAAVIEVHFGGKYNSTNIVQNPVATSSTTIGLDHIEGLGGSQETVAWNKAGIFKPSARAFSSPQIDAVQCVPEQEALAQNVRLRFTNPKPRGSVQEDIQTIDSCLAVGVTECYLQKMNDYNPISSHELDMALNLLPRQLPGRMNVIPWKPSRLFIDVAHNMMSMERAGRWFLQECRK
jgi:folylpolyglutamate synthase